MEKGGESVAKTPPKVVEFDESFLSDKYLSNLVTMDEEAQIKKTLSEEQRKLQKIIDAHVQRVHKRIISRMCLCVMFVTMVLLMGYAHVNHRRLKQAAIKKHKERALFTSEQDIGLGNTVSLYDHDNLRVLHGFFGEENQISQRYDVCYEKKTGAICMQWKGFSRINFKFHSRPGIMCYNIIWKSYNETIDPEDCFDMPGYWYGGGQTPKMDWPIDIGNLANDMPFVTGDANKHQWGSVLQRSFFNSRGISITVDELTPLQVSTIVKPEKRLCVKAKYDSAAFIYPLTPHPVLNYNVCVSYDIKAIHAYIAERNIRKDMTPSEINAIKNMMAQPIFHVEAPAKSMFTAGLLWNYTLDVLSSGIPQKGYLLLNELWQAHLGDFDFDSDRFPNIKDILDAIHFHELKVVVTIQPFVSTESKNFQNLINQHMLVQVKGEQGYIPAMTTYKGSVAVGVLDVTNEKTIKWLQTKLAKIRFDYKCDALYIDFGNAYNMPHMYQFKKILINPDNYMNIFLEAINKKETVIGVSSAIVMPKPTTFVSLPRLNNTWESLSQIVPMVLTYGISGFPFIMPNVISGNFDFEDKFFGIDLESETTTEQIPKYSAVFEESELYFRWMQLATFLPVVQYMRLPTYFGNDSFIAAAIELRSLRTETLDFFFERYAKEALDTGLPIIRPLWMLDPNNTECLTLKDQFAIGGEIVVAPILTPGAVKRDVYLPSGVWKDGMTDVIRPGGRWYRNYELFGNMIPFFQRVVIVTE